MPVFAFAAASALPLLLWINMANEPLKAAVVTDIGMAKLEAAYLAGEKVVISEMALGDSNLVYVKPNSSFTELVNEFGRQAINDGNTTESWINALVYVDSTQFANKSVLEFGLYDSDGDLIVYSSYTPSLVPDIGPNYIQLEIECSVNLYNASAVTLEVTPIYPQATEFEMGIAKVATNALVDAGTNDDTFLTVKKFLYALDVTHVIDKLVSNLWLKLAAKICPVGVPLPWPSDIAPEGFAIHKGQAFDKVANPELAKLYPDGILKDLRGMAVVGKKEGEIILSYEADQIKQHGHPNSTVSSTDLGSRNTNTTGNHAHGYPAGTSNGPNGPYLDTAHASYGYRYTTTEGNHYHSVAIGSHAHSIAIALFGATENTIKNIKFNWIVRMG
ncbi:phage tail protein [Vibrio cholerae]|nr:phage tail protein [Vibrio cholerae]EGQ8660265.1 phage tail protein [Vibrio cholerae]MEB5552743.1 phage tail protein [Vibrio cholerae]